MRRGFTILELLTVVAMLVVVTTCFTTSVARARARARLAKATDEMASIVAEVGGAKNPEDAAARYRNGEVRDPWGNAYQVEIRRVSASAGQPASACGTTAVWFPNAYRPAGGGR